MEFHNIGKEINSKIKAAESTFNNTEKSIESVFKGQIIDLGNSSPHVIENGYGIYYREFEIVKTGISQIGADLIHGEVNKTMNDSINITDKFQFKPKSKKTYIKLQHTQEQIGQTSFIVRKYNMPEYDKQSNNVTENKDMRKTYYLIFMKKKDGSQYTLKYVSFYDTYADFIDIGEDGKYNGKQYLCTKSQNEIVYSGTPPEESNTAINFLSITTINGAVGLFVKVLILMYKVDIENIGIKTIADTSVVNANYMFFIANVDENPGTGFNQLIGDTVGKIPGVKRLSGVKIEDNDVIKDYVDELRKIKEKKEIFEKYGGKKSKKNRKRIPKKSKSQRKKKSIIKNPFKKLR
jgi:hypothetical protein